MIFVHPRIAFKESVLANTASADRNDAADRDERFSALVRRQSGFVYRVAYSVLRNTHDSEDAVQETFLKLFRAGTWDRIEDERAFLARAVWRVAVDRLRARRHVDVSSVQCAELDIAETGRNSEETAILKDRDAAVHRLIDALPQELRLPLALSTVDELNSREIAAIVGVPEGTVRTRLARARQILRTKLAAGKWGPSRENRHE